MSYAQTNGYIVFTNDLDFGTLLAIAKSQLPSVVQVRNQDLLPAAIGDVVISALRQVKEQLQSGALITIDRSRLRVRILPIGWGVSLRSRIRQKQTVPVEWFWEGAIDESEQLYPEQSTTAFAIYHPAAKYFSA